MISASWPRSFLVLRLPIKNGITSAIVSYDETGHVTKVVVQQSGRTCTYDASKGTYEVGDTAPVAGGSDSDT